MGKKQTNKLKFKKKNQFSKEIFTKNLKKYHFFKKKV